MDDLLEQAQANISENVDKQQKEKLYLVLQESLNELSGLEELNKTYKELRDQAIKDLYNVGISRTMVVSSAVSWTYLGQYLEPRALL